MTLTDPTGDPDLLQAVLATAHDRLDSLLTEVARANNTDTPGVANELASDLVAELVGHLNAEAMVVQPEVGAVLGESEQRQMADESHVLGALAKTSRFEGYELLAGAFADHRHMVESVLGRLRDAAGAPRMASLGYDYVRAAEAASQTHLT